MWPSWAEIQKLGFLPFFQKTAYAKIDEILKQVKLNNSIRDKAAQSK